MATQLPPAPDIPTASAHLVALPYRGDGVAWALRHVYRADDNALPSDMLKLLLAIEEPPIVSDPG